MADYDGYMMLDEDSLVVAIVPITNEMIEDVDANEYADSYTPQEGCDP